MKILAGFFYSLHILNLLAPPLHPPVRKEYRSEQSSFGKSEPTRQSKAGVSSNCGSGCTGPVTLRVLVVMTTPVTFVFCWGNDVQFPSAKICSCLGLQFFFSSVIANVVSRKIDGYACRVNHCLMVPHEV